jgi:hypothetical protein
VKASIEIAGTFEKWSASVKFRSPERTSAILDIRIQAASVHTGSDVKDGKLKGKDFFDAEQSPLIRFHSTKVVQTDPETVEFEKRYCKDVLWSPSYFAASCGGAPLGIIKQYVEQQKTPL